ncbi:Ferredoxin--nitrite reductase [hydrothermal vent metagenome]|uniref:Ferredoxin--nitrite reductase n=1 Tax=hydrothermal vent metagenome TaxID=652676 RepID=A0A1W1BFV2_9ZZZZ
MIEALQKAYEARSKKLNKIEKLKSQKSPKEAIEKLKEYARDGYDSIPEEDKSYFLKCFGIYDRPATPKRFMLKLRIPAGHLNAAQAEVIGECAKEFGEDYIDLTTRSQCELRYLRIEDLPTIIERLENVGINAYQTGVDNIRGIMGDPFDALAFDNILPSHHLILKMQEIFLKNYEWISAIPRKFNVAITGNIANRCNVFCHDLSFALAQKDGVYGYNVYLGGKVGVVGKSANIFVKNEEEVLALFKAVITLFKTYGFRDNRNKNRLYFLIDAVGIVAMRAAICEQAGIEFPTAGQTMTQLDYYEPDQGKVQLKDGSFGVHAVVPSGIFKGSSMMEAARLAKEYGNGELRLDMEQSLYILGIKDVEALLQESFFQEYKSVHSPYFNHLIACAGTQHCPFGVIENKNDAIAMANYLDESVPLKNARIRMYWSACVKGCGIHGLGDIGFEGCKAKIEGKSVSGVNIFLGGKIAGTKALEGRTIIKAAPLKYAKYFVESLLLEYKRLRKSDESFEAFTDRVLRNFTPAKIGFMMQLLAYLRAKKIDVDFGFEVEAKTGKNEEFEVFELGRKLFYQLAKVEPYSAYERFSNALKNEKPKDIKEFIPDIDENIAKMLEHILHKDETKRAVVFSELTPYIMLYQR